MTIQSTLSPVLAWAQTQNAAISTDSNEKHNTLKEMSQVFMTMLQNASSNPLSQTDPAEGMRLIQGLVEAHSRIEEGERLKGMEKALMQNNLLQAASLVGKKGQFQGNGFQIGDTKDDIVYEIPKGQHLRSLEISVHRGDGQKINILRGSTAEGMHSLNDVLHRLPKGRYSLHVKGVDADDKEVPIDVRITAKLEHLNFKDGKIFVGAAQNLQSIDKLKALYSADYTFDAGQASTNLASNIQL